MNNTTRNAELLAPAGNFEKLRAAIAYGANAVYLAGQRFGMRASADNFTPEELSEAVAYCHARGVRLYVTVNVMPHTEEYPALDEWLLYLEKIGVDAVIVSDIGVLTRVRELTPSLELHISTQASAVSAQACMAWHALGARRIVLARELSLENIRRIRRQLPDTVELEAFIHGAMCIAYSGRCLLSNYFTGRDANHGCCAQPCRWSYTQSFYGDYAHAHPERDTTALQNGDSDMLEAELAEANRPDTPVAIAAVEDKGETFFLSSRDTCMIEHIPDLETSGIDSYKIEGRMKSAYYTAVVTNTYRMALDTYRTFPDSYRLDAAWKRELESVSHREYGTGFYYGSPAESANTVTSLGYIREKAYLATAITDGVPTGEKGVWEAVFIQRNKLSAGETVELISPGRCGKAFFAEALWNEEGIAIPTAPHPGMHFRLHVPFPVREGDILRQG